MSVVHLRPAAALAALAALAVPVAAQPRANEVTTIKVTSLSVTLKENDRPPKGASKGDTVVFRDKLVNAVAQFGKKVGEKVGSDRGTMTFTSKNSAVYRGSTTLPGGTILLKGGVTSGPDGKSIVIPVTGGTGRYKGATGFVLVGPGKTRSLNTYLLKLAAGPVA
jgi:hypothetical protein